MLKSIATVSLSGALPEKLIAIAAAGFDGYELFENDLVACDMSPADIKRLADSLGLVCTCYQPFRDFEGLSGLARARGFARAERKFDLMQSLGAELMLVCSSVAPDSSGDVARIVGDFQELGDRAAARGVRVGYEALAWGQHIHDHRQAWDVVRRADHPAIGLILDSFHSLARGIPLESLRDIPGARIFLLQIADAPGVTMDPLFWSRHFRCFPGQGDFPISDYVAAVLGQGYAGPLSLEIFNDRFRAWSAQQIAEDGARSLTVLAGEVARRQGEVDALPARAIPRGVRFIEFAADGADADELAALFTAMGFAQIGRHRRKDVLRFRQGSIDLILNREREGFARAHRLAHGASVCAIGMGVDDPAAAMSRARALAIRGFDQQAAPGELRIPAVRGVGGALLYFTPNEPDEAFWAQDFEPIPEQATARPAGLFDIDHIAQSSRPEEFLSWMLYYTALFDIRKTTPVDIADPMGLVQSQAVEASDGAVRITLNGASGRTLASRFVDNYFGAGIQHIAFRTADIVATVEYLRANGVEMLEFPDNYYADLRARFDLSPEETERLQRFNLMYDRSAHGDYLQAYGRAFQKRFFFEFVERRDYAGYGAPNTAVRLASQARAGGSDLLAQL